MCPFIIHYPLIEVDYIVRYITWNKKEKGGILRIKIYLMIREYMSPLVMHFPLIEVYCIPRHITGYRTTKELKYI